MKLVIQKWGSSAAIRLPALLLERLGVTLGDKLSVDMQADGMVLRPASKRYVLADLMAQCDLKAAPLADIKSWGAVSGVDQSHGVVDDPS
jgi:antitoxin ChpS